MPKKSRMAQIRKHLKITQKDLARGCGFKSTSRISMYETGARNILLKDAKMIVDFFNERGFTCSIETVFYQDGL